MLDLSFCAIDFEGSESPVDFGKSTKYKIKNILFYSCGKDISGGLLSEQDFRNILQGIQACSLINSLKRISILDIGIEEDTLKSMMEEYQLDHINLTKDY